MGNIASCYNAPAPQTSTVIDADGIFRQIKVPITAAEVMLDEPGYVLAPVLQIRENRGVPALKADEQLLPGKFYLLVSSGRAHSKVSQTEMEVIDLVCKPRRMKQRRRGSSKVLPAVDNQSPVTMLSDDVTGALGYSLENRCRWTPSLDSISEQH